MKNLIRSIIMAFQMFTILPMPMVEWKKENMKYMLAMLPCVGVVIGLADWLWLALCNALRLGSILFAAGVTLLPLFLTGGIHMDGFCDTVDALSSHADPERKREILKDSNAGAFAVIFAGAYLLLFFALATELPRTGAAVAALTVHQVLGRVLGSLSSALFPSASAGGLQHTFRDACARGGAVILMLWALAAAVVMCLFCGVVNGAVCIIVAALGMLYVRYMSCRQFGGMNGDLAGYINTLAQLLMLLAYILVEKVVLL